MHFQPIYDLVETCFQKGITEAVLCPGSRCAPLSLAFIRHPGINTRTISDEKSAAFIACGISLYTRKPTVLVCTSGSAAYHFAPAVAESFFQHIPLIVMTADRPKEWINQWDGQTLWQHDMYGKNVKKSYELPQDYKHPDSLWSINRIINEAVNLSNHIPKGPVHINVPLREPLYPEKNHTPCFSTKVRVIKSLSLENQLSKKLLENLKKTLLSLHNILIVVGQNEPDKNLTRGLKQFSQTYCIPVITEIISNQHGLPYPIAHADILLEQEATEFKNNLQPELLITFGKHVLSKNIKKFIRRYTPDQHWHIQQDGTVADPYQSLTHIIPISPTSFFKQLGQIHTVKKEKRNYDSLWKKADYKIQQSVHAFFKQPGFSEFHLVKQILNKIPEKCYLHLANSLPVRYANWVGLQKTQHDVHVISNRGVSGIDGCTSTACGHALASGMPTILITGDMAFFHDRNAFWHNYPIPNLRVVVLNNQGGGIFSVLKEPSELPELGEYFITQQNLSAQNLANEFGFEYLQPKHFQEMEYALDTFFDFNGKTKILEIKTEKKAVKKIIDQFTLHIKKSYET